MKKEDGKIRKTILNLFLLHKKYLLASLMCLILMSVFSFLQPLIIRKITDVGMLEKNMYSIILYSSILLFVSMIYQMTDIIQARLFTKIHNEITFSLYDLSYWKMNKLKIEYYHEKEGAEILHTISNDIGHISSITDQLTTYSITAVLQVIGGIVGLAVLNWKIAILVILFIPIKLVLVHFFSNKKRIVIEYMLESERDFFKWMGERFDGIREMRLWNLFQVKYCEFKKLQNSMMKSYYESCMLDKYKGTGISILDAILDVIQYIVCGWLIVKSDFTIGSAFAFITYSGYVASPITFITDFKYYFAEIKPSVKRFEEFMELPEEVGLNVQPQKDSTLCITKASSSNKSAIIEFINVQFGYELNMPILQNINLSIYPGEKIAIIGENGSGKSTLLNLLTGFYQPDKGSIKIYGRLINEWGVEYIRAKISVLWQNPYIFNETIEENVNIDRKAPHQKVIMSCRQSGAINFINKLDGGFEYCVGSNGAKLSGGERQKLGLARTLTKQAEILVLDEATSGIDKESNKEIVDLLCKELKNKTIIFITHRYEELENIDKVYKLAHGKLKVVK